MRRGDDCRFLHFLNGFALQRLNSDKRFPGSILIWLAVPHNFWYLAFHRYNIGDNEV